MKNCEKLLFFLFVFFLLFSLTCFSADFKVYGYDTPEKGEVEFVYFNNYFADSDQYQSFFGEYLTKDGHLSHSLEFEYGITDRWTIAAYLDFEQPKGEPLKYTQFRSVVFRYRFFKKGERFFNPAIYIEYYIPRKSYKVEEELEIKFILEKKLSEKFFIRLNPSVEKVTSGEEVEEGLEFNYASGLYWKPSESIRTGIEFFGKMGELAHLSEFDIQKHWIFPSIKIELLHHIEWEFGIGFGLSKTSDNFIIKNILSIEF